MLLACWVFIESQVNQNVKMVLVVKDTGVVCKIHEMSDYFGEIFI